ncbi:MAG: ABC transporter ATP-binding protein [Methanotrichaceae archaeon]|nr:ABC transporter ATP-binding protein [Methanotrichaceae archaeon]
MHPLRGVEIIPLDHVNIKVRAGEIFGILGPNGAGKTTLIKILCTLISPTEGEAYVNGHDVVRESELVRKSLGFITTDERSFYWRLTGRQNLEFFAALHDIYSEEADRRVNELLDIVHLSDRADDLFLSYSAGMKQRLAIARGLLNDPQVLFMDEPTRSLDPGAAQNIRDFIKKYIVREQGKTVFISTHNLEEAGQLCNSIAICDEGKIKALGSPEELKSGLDEGSTLHDVFLFHTGKRFEEDRGPKSAYYGRHGFRPKTGFGMRRRGF